jgi:hypothetical protein
MDVVTYDRSGRLDMDKFYIDPENGFVDSMRDRVGGMMGGIRATPELEKKPYQIIYELNAPGSIELIRRAVIARGKGKFPMLFKRFGRSEYFIRHPSWKILRSNI